MLTTKEIEGLERTLGVAETSSISVCALKCKEQVTPV